MTFHCLLENLYNPPRRFQVLRIPANFAGPFIELFEYVKPGGGTPILGHIRDGGQNG